MPAQQPKVLFLQMQVSSAMGFGFRCGFLGLLHMEIVQERLEREYDLDLIITAPTVVYRAMMTDGEEVVVDNPCLLPDAARREYISEPYVRSATVQHFTHWPGSAVLLKLAPNHRWGLYRTIQRNCCAIEFTACVSVIMPCSR